MSESYSPAPAFGSLLKEWRTFRRLSQLDLALAAESSARHLSFLETGRAQPSRDMVLKLAEALDVPLRERNTLLSGAGYAPMYRETALDDSALAPVRRALDYMLAQQEPFPALVVNGDWDLLLANQAATHLIGFLCGPNPPAPTGPPNVLHMMFDPAQLRGYIVDWETVARVALHRAYREALVSPRDEAAFALVDALSTYDGVPADWRNPIHPEADAPVLTVTFEKDGQRSSWFSTIATIGTAQDVTLQEIRIESFFPADEATEAFARNLAAAAAN